VLRYLARYVTVSPSPIPASSPSMRGSSPSATRNANHRAGATCRLSGHEFMRRCSAARSPKGLHKVRYFGTLAPLQTGQSRSSPIAPATRSNKSPVAQPAEPQPAEPQPAPPADLKSARTKQDSAPVTPLPILPQWPAPLCRQAHAKERPGTVNNMPRIPPDLSPVHACWPCNAGRRSCTALDVRASPRLFRCAILLHPQRPVRRSDEIRCQTSLLRVARSQAPTHPMFFPLKNSIPCATDWPYRVSPTSFCGGKRRKKLLKC